MKGQIATVEDDFWTERLPFFTAQFPTYYRKPQQLQSLFGIGFGGEMSAYLVVNRQYFGTGPTSTLYGWEMLGALLGHAVASGLAGLVLAVTGAFPPVLALSMAFSLVGVLVILHLESSARVLIPHWEESLPPEAQSTTMRPPKS